MIKKEKSTDYSTTDREKIANYWNHQKSLGLTPSLVDIVSFYSDGVESDPRSKTGHKVRKILSDLQLKATTKIHQKVEGITLNNSQKEFIDNNCTNNSPYEMAKTLFPSEGRLEPLGREVRAIVSYLKETDQYVSKKEGETLPEGRYEPPDKFHTVLAKINLYLHEELTTQSITAFERKCVETTLQFLHSPRFVQEINNYSTVEKRTSFESEFIRAVYNKPDLSPEEVSLTINWCSDIIQASDLKKQLEKLNEILNGITEDEGGKMSMSLAETIGKVQTHLNEVLKRQERIYQILNTARSKRTEDKENKQASLTALYEWFRDEENRKKMLRQAEIQRENRKTEVSKLESLDDIVFLSLGLSKSEAIY